MAKEQRYRVNRMFAHKFKDQPRATVFTRDNEHLLATLPEAVLKRAIKNGSVEEVAAPPTASRRRARSTEE